MIIYSKQYNIIANSDAVKCIYTSFIYSDYSIKADEMILAKYQTQKKAQEILRQIFIAMTDGLKTFELPED